MWVLTDLERRKDTLYKLPDTQPSLHTQLHHQPLNVFFAAITYIKKKKKLKGGV